MHLEEYEAPCGRLLIGVHGYAVCLCDWLAVGRAEATLRRIHKFLSPKAAPDSMVLQEETMHQLDEYFSGARISFDLPIMAFGTDFQRHIWATLRLVPYGQTASYRQIAEAADYPHGARAVASAIGANPMSIIVPCHRIIGADGSLTGYAGGLEAKRHLLQLEAEMVGRNTPPFTIHRQTEKL